MKTLLQRCHDALKSAGLNVRLANAPAHKCTAAYVAIYEGAEEDRDKCTAYRHIMAEIIVPKNGAVQMDSMTAKVRAAMADAGLRPVYAGNMIALEDYDALSVSMDFRALCARR